MPVDACATLCGPTCSPVDGAGGFHVLATPLGALNSQVLTADVRSVSVGQPSPHEPLTCWRNETKHTHIHPRNMSQHTRMSLGGRKGDPQHAPKGVTAELPEVGEGWGLRAFPGHVLDALAQVKRGRVRV